MSYTILLGDLGPVMPVQLLDNGQPFVLNSVTDTVVLNYELPDGTTLSKGLSIVTPLQGQCAAAWVAGDLPQVGIYRGIVKVVRNGDTTFPRSFPNDSSHVVWAIYQTIPQGSSGEPEAQAAYYPLQPQAGDPTPANIPDYLWLGFAGLRLTVASIVSPLLFGWMVTYTATGTEGTDIMVPVGAVMADATYGVFPACAGGTSGDGTQSSGVQLPDLPKLSRSTTQFRVVFGQQPAAGDVFQFIVLGQSI